jgi:hypothetical protein
MAACHASSARTIAGSWSISWKVIAGCAPSMRVSDVTDRVERLTIASSVLLVGRSNTTTKASRVIGMPGLKPPTTAFDGSCSEITGNNAVAGISRCLRSTDTASRISAADSESSGCAVETPAGGA